MNGVPTHKSRGFIYIICPVCRSIAPEPVYLVYISDFINLNEKMKSYGTWMLKILSNVSKIQVTIMYASKALSKVALHLLF